MSNARLKWQKSKLKIKQFAQTFRRKRPRGWMMASLVLSGCARWPENADTQHTAALSDFQRTSLAKMNAGQAQDSSGFRWLYDGAEALAARLMIADLAEKTLDVQYYMIRNDETSKTVTYALMEAANRGVRVRVLLDDLYALGADYELSLLHAHPYIEIRVFNPFRSRGSMGVAHLLEFLRKSERLNRRMHNKIFVADNAHAIVGGRNIANEYFVMGPTPSFIDLDVLAVGPIVRETSTLFDEYWNSEFAVPIDALYKQKTREKDQYQQYQLFEALFTELKQSTYATRMMNTQIIDEFRTQNLRLHWGHGYVESDAPGKNKEERHVFRGTAGTRSITQLLLQANASVTFISPYFVPGAEGVAAIKALVEKGVEVKVLTNALTATDHVLVHSGYAKYRQQILRAGALLFEMRPDTLDVKSWKREKNEFGRSRASLHAKAIVIDERISVVGSANLDPRSGEHNTELMYVIESTEAATELLSLLNEVSSPKHSFRVVLDEDALQWITEDESGKIYHFKKEPMTSAWKRAWVTVLGWLTPEGLL